MRLGGRALQIAGDATIRRFAGPAIVALWLCATPISAAVLEVDGATDSVDASPGDGLCSDASGACTLRAAVMESNALAGADTIHVPAGRYVLSLPPASGVPEDAGGDLDVTDVVTVAGAGARVTVVDAGGFSGVLAVGGVSGRVGFQDLTLTGAVGPGLHVLVADDVHLSRLVISGNAASQSAGGIEAFHSSLTLSDSTVSANSGLVGGILARSLLPGQRADVVDSTISGNVGSFVGGIYATSVGVNVVNSTISGNAGSCDVETCREGCYGGPWGAGAVLAGWEGEVRLLHSTVAENLCPMFDGSPGWALLGTITTLGSVISSAGGWNCGDTVQSAGHNVDADGTCLLSDPSDLSNVDPLLGPLADNGGPTPTHALRRGSPAIDAIPASECGTYDDDGEPGTPEVSLATDRRGVKRPRRSSSGTLRSCDIGSYEATACANGIDDDHDGRIDFDGGTTAGLVPPERTEPDLRCASALSASELGSCGLGAELLLLGPLGWWRRRARSAESQG
jgi:hypothetical protein